MTTVTARRRPRRAYHHGDLKRSLVASGLALLEREGMAGLSLRHVAEAAGVSAAAPYAHFPDKAALLAAIAETGFEEFTTALRRPLARPPRERLDAMALAYVQFARNHPALFRLMFGTELTPTGTHPALHEKAAASYGELRDAVSALLPAGAPEAAREAAVTAAWAVVHGLAILILDGRVAAGAAEAEVKRRIAAATGLISRGIAG